jgi:hypothetical protein
LLIVKTVTAVALPAIAEISAIIGSFIEQKDGEGFTGCRVQSPEHLGSKCAVRPCFLAQPQVAAGQVQEWERELVPVQAQELERG